jgi:signal transduction histidine kinase
MCAAIAAAHGGSIRLEDEAPSGAHFTVRLPALEHAAPVGSRLTL